MKTVTVLFLTLLSLTVFGQTETETIKKANDLIANKKYESAFNLLDSLDPKNNKPDIVLLKENIVLNYFVSSIMHRMFALKDLEKNEDIMTYRGSNGAFNLHAFYVDSILESLIKKEPANCELYKGLGNYYYEVYSKYEGEWLKSDKELFKLMQTNFQKTIDDNCADFFSYYVLGYINLVQEKYKESIHYFLNAIEKNKDYADSFYNLACAYLYTNDRQSALKYAKSSLDLYTDKDYKSDAARVLGQIYSELNDDKNALENYELADKIDPENYYNLKPLLNLYVKMGSEKSEETTKAFFDLAPEKPTIYNDLVEIYHSYKKENDLISFYKSQLSNYKDNNKVQGSLNFYLGMVNIGFDKKIAKEYFLKSKEIFSKVFNKDHQVFKAIDDGLKQCGK